MSMRAFNDDVWRSYRKVILSLLYIILFMVQAVRYWYLIKEGRAANDGGGANVAKIPSYLTSNALLNFTASVLAFSIARVASGRILLNSYRKIISLYLSWGIEFPKTTRDRRSFDYWRNPYVTLMSYMVNIFILFYIILIFSRLQQSIRLWESLALGAVLALIPKIPDIVSIVRMLLLLARGSSRLEAERREAQRRLPVLLGELSELAQQFPRLDTVALQLARWLELHPRESIISTGQIVEEAPEVDAADLGLLLALLSQRGELDRCFVLATPTYHEAAPWLFHWSGDVRLGPSHSFERTLSTREGEIRQVFLRAGARPTVVLAAGELR